MKDIYYESVQGYDAIPGMPDCECNIQEVTGSYSDYPFHWHHALEITLVLEGSIAYTAEGIRHVTEAGNCHLINSQVVHNALNENPNGRLKAMVLLLSDQFMAEILPDHCRCSYGILPNTSAYSKINALLYEIFDYRMSNYPIDRMMIGSRILEIVYILNKYCVIQRNTGKEYSKDVIRYVSEHYHEDITLDAISSFVGLQKNYFCRCFLKETGMTFKSYLNHVRLDAALSYMKNHNETVLTSALTAGFHSEKVMIDWCRKIYGVTPTVYIRRMNGAAAASEKAPGRRSASCLGQ